MSRITYLSEAEVRDVAAKLRAVQDPGRRDPPRHRLVRDRLAQRLPVLEDALHRSGEDDRRSEEGRLPRLAVAATVLRAEEPLFPEIVEQGPGGARRQGRRCRRRTRCSTSRNPKAVDVVQGEARRRCCSMGVGAIKVDFGEAAPLDGHLRLRAHRVVRAQPLSAALQQGGLRTSRSEVNRREHDLGAQRVGREPALSAALGRRRREHRHRRWPSTLRGGLSFGLSGFTFWSHDIGGFMGKTRRGSLSPLAAVRRAHVAQPHATACRRASRGSTARRSSNDFRRAVEMRYRSCRTSTRRPRTRRARGLPMLRALFFEYPEDPGSWSIEDEYMFGATCSSRRCSRPATSRARLPAAGQVDRLPDRPRVRRRALARRSPPARCRSCCS